MKLNNLSKMMVASMVALSTLATPFAVSAQDTTIKIGGNFELTGPVASYGSSGEHGAQLAIELLKAAGENVEYVAYDNKSDKTEAATVAQKLADEKVVGIVGPMTTGDALATIPAATENALPTVFPAATGEGVTMDGDKVLDFVFRVPFTDNFQGVAGAQVAIDKLGAKKAVVLVDQSSEYSQGLAENFKKTFEEKGGEIVSEEAYATGDTDFNSVLTNISVLDFDVLYVPGYYTEVGLIIKQARELAIAQPILGGDGFESTTLLELAGEANLTDVYYTNHYSALSEEEDVQAFIKAYEEKFGEQPDSFAALAFDATNLLYQAAKASGATDGKALSEAIATTKEFDGVTGTFSFDETHTPVKSAVLIEYKDGKVASTEEVSAK